MSALLAIVAAPLLAAALILALRRGVAALALAGAGVSLAGSALLAAQVATGGGYGFAVPWLPEWPLTLSATPTTSLLALTVATVSSLVLAFAIGYMRDEPGRLRFFAIMSLFVAAMQALVLAGDWMVLLVAWELIGFCSYLLIGHWHGRTGVPAAASRAFLYTRSADVGLFIAVFMLIARSGSSDIAATLADGPLRTGVGLLLLLAVMGKSAQLPLQGWLQRAMVGPTPVSALLHSATLVAAGTILLIRAAPLLSPEVSLAVALVGGATAIGAGLMALAANDLKQVLAASTSSQYGLMLLAIAAGYPAAALMHLLAHAAIKSALFLQAGALQKAYGSTGLAELEGAARQQRALGAALVLSALALVGLPPLSGMFSKDALLAAALKSDHAGLYGSLVLAGVVLSGAYMGRVLRVLLRAPGRAATLPSPLWMGLGIAGLTLLAIALGPALKPLVHWASGSVPKSHLAFALGIAMAVLGLAWGGWLARPLPGPLRAWAARGFAVGGGWYGVAATPMLAAARGCDLLDRRLHGAVTGFGRGIYSVAKGCAIVDGLLHFGVRRFGGATGWLARGTRITDERGIDGLIGLLVQTVRSYGASARRLQSGLVHRELMLTAGGAGVTLLLVVVMSV